MPLSKDQEQHMSRLERQRQVLSNRGELITTEIEKTLLAGLPARKEDIQNLRDTHADITKFNKKLVDFVETLN